MPIPLVSLIVILLVKKMDFLLSGKLQTPSQNDGAPQEKKNIHLQDIHRTLR